jgi:hypothetical protein
MLRPLMLNRVGGEVHSGDIVAVDEHALGERGCEAQPRAVGARTPQPRR